MEIIVSILKFLSKLENAITKLLAQICECDHGLKLCFHYRNFQRCMQFKTLIYVRGLELSDDHQDLDT